MHGGAASACPRALVWPLACRDEGGTGHWLPALGSQKRDPAAARTPRQLPPGTLSVSGRASSRHLSPPRAPPSAGVPRAGQGMNREGAPGKSPEDVYVQQKVRVLLMLRKMGSNVSAVRWVTRHSPPRGTCCGQSKGCGHRLWPPWSGRGHAEPVVWLCG